MINPSPLPAPAFAPSLRRALGIFGASFGMMLVVSLVFYALKGPNGGINIPSLSVAISLFAVLAPVLVGCFWPRTNAPGLLPPFRALSPWLLAGIACLSLPCYQIFAALQIAVGKILPGLHMDTGLVEPLTAGTPLLLMWIWFAIALLPALTEEALYRGVVQSATVARFGPLAGIAAASVLFSLAHMEPAGFLSRILMGLWFGYLFFRTRSVWAGALAHALNNSWGVALANWHGSIEAHLPLVYLAGVVAAGLGYACLHLAGFWPWQREKPLALAGGAPAGPDLPRFVQIRPIEPTD